MPYYFNISFQAIECQLYCLNFFYTTVINLTFCSLVQGFVKEYQILLVLIDYSVLCYVNLFSASDLVEGVLQGRNGSVFCYGATGAGKTYTMLGTIENPGVMVLAIKDLFSKIRQRSYDGDHSVQLSYLEVYNETVRDLLSPGRPLVLREDKQVP